MQISSPTQYSMNVKFNQKLVQNTFCKKIYKIILLNMIMFTNLVKASDDNETVGTTTFEDFRQQSNQTLENNKDDNISAMKGESGLCLENDTNEVELSDSEYYSCEDYFDHTSFISDIEKSKNNEEYYITVNKYITELTSEQNELVVMFFQNFFENINIHFINFEFKPFTDNLNGEYKFDPEVAVYRDNFVSILNQSFEKCLPDLNILKIKKAFADIIFFFTTKYEYSEDLFGKIKLIQALLKDKKHEMKSIIDEFITQYELSISEYKEEIKTIKKKIDHFIDEKIVKVITTKNSESPELIQKIKNEIIFNFQNLIDKECIYSFDFCKQELRDLFVQFRTDISSKYNKFEKNVPSLKFDLLKMFGTEYQSANIYFEYNLIDIKSWPNELFEKVIVRKDKTGIEKFFFKYLKELKKIDIDIERHKKVLKDIPDDKHITLSKNDTTFLIDIALENYKFLFYIKTLNDYFLEIITLAFIKHIITEKSLCSSCLEKIQERFYKKGSYDRNKYPNTQPIGYIVTNDKGKTNYQFYIKILSNHECVKSHSDYLLIFETIKNNLNAATIYYKNMKNNFQKYLINVLMECNRDETKCEELKSLISKKYGEKESKMMKLFAG